LSEKEDDWCRIKVDDVEEDFERLDVADIVNVTLMLEKNKNEVEGKKQLTKDMLVKCPELNF